jgi:ParB family transcriptional regulator, chromosome partitioning protein
MKRRPGGLGRGLDALLPARAAAGGVLELDVAAIRPNPAQPRTRIPPDELAELAASIAEHGVLQPIIVTGGDEGYLLIAGERRWRAAQLAGRRTIPAVVKEATDQERLELALVENLQRQDLTPLEEAAAYRQLVAEHGLTQEAVATRVGKSRVAVANALRLLNLAPVARDALLAGRITAGHARALLACPDDATQEQLLARVLATDLSVRATEELVRRGIGPRARSALPASVEVAAVEQQLRQALGTKVQLQRSRRGGRIVIHYYSDDELQGLFERLTGGPQ